MEFQDKRGEVLFLKDQPNSKKNIIEIILLIFNENLLKMDIQSKTKWNVERNQIFLSLE